MQLLATDGLRVTGLQHGSTRQDAALLADGLRHPDDDVIEERRVQRIAIPQRFEKLGGQLHRRYFVQRAIGPSLASRRANMIVDIGFHLQFPISRGRT